jgi:hypothetical protein
MSILFFSGAEAPCLEGDLPAQSSHRKKIMQGICLRRTTGIEKCMWECVRDIFCHFSVRCIQGRTLQPLLSDIRGFISEHQLHISRLEWHAHRSTQVLMLVCLINVRPIVPLGYALAVVF